MISPATMMLLASVYPTPSQRAQALRADAWLTMFGGFAAATVIVLHARGRSSEAAGVALVSTALATVGQAARLFAAAAETEHSDD